jgi:hypothetical protein
LYGRRETDMKKYLPAYHFCLIAYLAVSETPMMYPEISKENFRLLEKNTVFIRFSGKFQYYKFTTWN